MGRLVFDSHTKQPEAGFWISPVIAIRHRIIEVTAPLGVVSKGLGENLKESSKVSGHNGLVLA